MPLRSGSDKATVSANIRELIRSGRKPDQAIAIAMSNARRHAVGGLVNRRFADGGGLFGGTGNNLFQSTPGATPDTSSSQIGTGPTPMENWQQNTPALNPQADAWTSAANSRLQGWEGGPAPLNAYGGNQIGFGPTPLQQWYMQGGTGTATPGATTLPTTTPALTTPPAPAPTSDIPGAGGLIPSQGANTAYPNTYGGPNYTPTNTGVGTNPYGASTAYTGMPQYRPAYTTPAGSTIQAGPYGSIPLTQEQMNQFMGATGLKGQAFLDALPAPIRPAGVTPDIISAYNTTDAALRAAMQAGTVTPELSQQAAAASNAYQMAMYGPLYKMIGPQVSAGGAPQINPANMIGGGGVIVPHAPRVQPLTPQQQRLAALNQYGYGSPTQPWNSVSRQQGQQNALQTLKAAGWNPSMGYGPQTNWGSPSSLQSVNDKRAAMLNDLLRGVAPMSAADKAQQQQMERAGPDPAARARWQAHIAQSVAQGNTRAHVPTNPYTQTGGGMPQRSASYTDRLQEIADQRAAVEAARPAKNLTPATEDVTSSLGPMDQSLGPSGSNLASWLRPYLSPEGQTVPFGPPQGTAGMPGWLGQLGQGLGQGGQGQDWRSLLQQYMPQGGQGFGGIPQSGQNGFYSMYQDWLRQHPGGMASGGKVGGLGRTMRGPPDEPSDRATMIPVGLIR